VSSQARETVGIFVGHERPRLSSPKSRNDDSELVGCLWIEQRQLEAGGLN
jgi:hypothetical protein